MFFDEYLVFDVKIQMCDEGVNLNSFFVRRFFLRFPLKASTYVAERCNTRNKKNETSSHP